MYQYNPCITSTYGFRQLRWNKTCQPSNTRQCFFFLFQCFLSSFRFDVICSFIHRYIIRNIITSITSILVFELLFDRWFCVATCKHSSSSYTYTRYYSNVKSLWPLDQTSIDSRLENDSFRLFCRYLHHNHAIIYATLALFHFI